MSVAGDILSQMGGDPIANARSLAKSYSASVQKEQSDPAIKQARSDEVSSIDKDRETLAEIKGKEEQEGVDFQNQTKPWNADEERQKYAYDPVKAFGSAGSVFAMLAAAFTHTPMISALNGAASAMESIRSGDEKSYNDAFDAWQKNTETALRRHQAMHEDWQDVINLASKDQDLAHSKAVALAAQYGDQQAQILASSGQWAKLAELVNARNSNAVHMEEAQGPIMENRMKQQVYFSIINDWKIKHGAKVTTDKNGHAQIVGGPTQVPGSVLTEAYAATKNPALVAGSSEPIDIPKGSSEDQIKATVREADPRAYKIFNYELPPPSGFGSNSPALKSLYHDIKLLEDATGRTYSAPRYNEVNKAVSQFGASPHGDLVRTFNVGVQHIDTLGQAAKALGNGDLQTANSLFESAAQKFGYPAPTNFDAVKQIVAGEVTKAIIGSGAGGRTALGDRKELEDNLSRVDSPQQLAQLIDHYKTLMGAQLNGLKKQYESSTGLDNFDDMLMPETRSVLQGGGAASGGFKIEEEK